MKITIFSLFPEMFQGPLTTSLIGKAVEKQRLDIEIVNFRDYAQNKFKHVDDTPYGGGVGMLLQPQPIVDALRAHIPAETEVPIILVSPQGKVFNQAEANRLAKQIFHSKFNDICRLVTTITRNYIKLYSLTFFERLITVTLNGRKVHKDILAFANGDKTIALFIIEPFYFSCHH